MSVLPGHISVELIPVPTPVPEEYTLMFVGLDGDDLERLPSLVEAIRLGENSNASHSPEVECTSEEATFIMSLLDAKARKRDETHYHFNRFFRVNDNYYDMHVRFCFDCPPRA